MYTTCLKSQTIIEKCSKQQHFSNSLVSTVRSLRFADLAVFCLLAEGFNYRDEIRDYSQEYMGEVIGVRRQWVNVCIKKLCDLGLLEKYVGSPILTKYTIQWQTAQYKFNPAFITNTNLRAALSDIIPAFKKLPIYFGLMLSMQAFNQHSRKNRTHNYYTSELHTDSGIFKQTLKQMLEEFAPTSEEIYAFENQDWDSCLDALRLSCS